MGWCDFSMDSFTCRSSTINHVDILDSVFCLAVIFCVVGSWWPDRFWIQLLQDMHGNWSKKAGYSQMLWVFFFGNGVGGCLGIFCCNFVIIFSRMWNFCLSVNIDFRYYIVLPSPQGQICLLLRLWEFYWILRKLPIGLGLIVFWCTSRIEAPGFFRISRFAVQILVF